MPDLNQLRQKKLLEHYAKFQCEHPTKELRKRTVKGGGSQYVDQCLTCGDPLTSPISREKAVAQNGGKEPPPFDSKLKTDREAERERGAQEIIGHFKSRGEYERAEFLEWHTIYLASPEWKERRGRVLKRASGLCEGCLESPATEVHHLTYEHVGNEFMFELVALCNLCHVRIHEKPKSEEELDE